MNFQDEPADPRNYLPPQRHRPYVTIEADIFIEDRDATAADIAREGWDLIYGWMIQGYLPVLTVTMFDGTREEVDLEQAYGIEALVEDLAEEGRRLASQREDLIAQGVDPDELDVPLHPDDEP